MFPIIWSLENMPSWHWEIVEYFWQKTPKTNMFFGVLQDWGFISQRIRPTVILPKQLICNYKSLLPPTVMNDC